MLWRLLDEENKLVANSWLSQLWQDVLWLKDHTPNFFQQTPISTLASLAELVRDKPAAWKVCGKGDTAGGDAFPQYE